MHKQTGRKEARTCGCVLKRHLGVAKQGSFLEGASQGNDDASKGGDGEEKPKPLDRRHHRHRAHVQADDPHSWHGQGANVSTVRLHPLPRPFYMVPLMQELPVCAAE
jgi:hypothetical protein